VPISLLLNNNCDCSQKAREREKIRAMKNHRHHRHHRLTDIAAAAVVADGKAPLPRRRGFSLGTIQQEAKLGLCGSESLGAWNTAVELSPAQLERCSYTRCEMATRRLTACRSLKSPAIPRPNLDNAAVKMLYYGRAGGSECCILLPLKA
jgi:hypothetical protein